MSKTKTKWIEDLAITAAKIADDAIIPVKIDAASYYHLRDDFVDSESNTFSKWGSQSNGVNSAVEKINDAQGGQLLITSDATDNSFFILKSNAGERHIRVAHNPVLEFGVQLVETANAEMHIGAYNGTTNLIEVVSDVSAGEWRTKTISGGSLTSNDIGTTDTDWHNWKIVCTASNVYFFLDGVLEATHTTNIPSSTLDMYVRVALWTDGSPGTDRTMGVDYVNIHGERNYY